MSDSSKKSFSLTKKDVDLMEWIRKAFRGERESPTEIKKLVPSLDVQRPGNVVSALMAQMGPGLWGGWWCVSGFSVWWLLCGCMSLFGVGFCFNS